MKLLKLGASFGLKKLREDFFGNEIYSKTTTMTGPGITSNGPVILLQGKPYFFTIVSKKMNNENITQVSVTDNI